MLKNLKKKQEGFTIIEVMIVLVIAAVILLIVFLAVPALQRNSRNTQRKNEAASLLAAASEYSSNNNGKVPGSVSGSVSADVTAIKALTKNRNITELKIESSTGTTAATLSQAVLRYKSACDTTVTPVVTKTGTSDRQIALLYQVEDGSGAGVNACAESGL